MIEVAQPPVLAEVQRRAPVLLVGLRGHHVESGDNLRPLAIDRLTKAPQAR
ncbi:hypothetical protein [Variovorax sp. RA8]|uniref:hypothetical protein n=1 Tax=Variovorax sp. (strain JCM 16519 / RA8) TaxID=662548 RepID=UPI0013A5BA10|nr:hypothetical protein [Variovorax sp. RA8]